MRILLAAVDCQKGDLDGNLARHVELLRQAGAAGCELAVFPEFSLTGSVDPRRRPDHTVTVADPSVAAVADAAHRAGVGALFGIAERRAEHFFISQLYAIDGRIAGVQRKRHLGEGEEAYTPAAGTGTFEYGALTFGAVICAEGGVAHTWEAAVATGARLVCFSSAPGLYGRRVDEAGWRDGHDWWRSSGLADARQHARTLGVWVAMATQAGSTVDEDFPGLAALVDPSGEVVAELPDWRPGTLVVDVPLSVGPVSGTGPEPGSAATR